jgi:hypothetical protein
MARDHVMPLITVTEVGAAALRTPGYRAPSQRG